MDIIIFSRPGNDLAIMVPAAGVSIKQILENDLPKDAINPAVVSDSILPVDRYFRDAWKRTGKTVSVDMARARDVHMANIRRVRNDGLKSLDVPWMIATANGKDKEAADVEKQKQVLRDIPEQFDLNKAKTLSELKALWPKELDRPKEG